MKGGEWKNGMCFWYDVSMTGNIYLDGPNANEYDEQQLDDLFIKHRGHPSYVEVVSSFNALKVLLTMHHDEEWVRIVGYTGDINDKEILIHGPLDETFNHAEVWVYLPTVKELIRSSLKVQFEQALDEMTISGITVPHADSMLAAIKKM